MELKVKEVSECNHGRYGTRRIRKVLQSYGLTVSRRRIGHIMHQYGLTSRYSRRRTALPKLPVNHTSLPNLIKRKFNDRLPLEALVCDLTYIWLRDKWAYICPIIDLWNREIVSFAVGTAKSADLVQRAISHIPYNLSRVSIFHTDRGGEFVNRAIDRTLEANHIGRSLSKGGTPLDNAVIESTNHIIKTECLNDYKFQSLDELNLIFGDYVHWYNHVRLHSHLGYKTPMQLRHSEDIKET